MKFTRATHKIDESISISLSLSCVSSVCDAFICQCKIEYIEENSTHRTGLPIICYVALFQKRLHCPMINT